MRHRWSPNLVQVVTQIYDEIISLLLALAGGLGGLLGRSLGGGLFRGGLLGRSLAFRRGFCFGRLTFSRAGLDRLRLRLRFRTRLGYLRGLLPVGQDLG